MTASKMENEALNSLLEIHLHTLEDAQWGPKFIMSSPGYFNCVDCSSKEPMANANTQPDFV